MLQLSRGSLSVLRRFVVRKVQSSTVPEYNKRKSAVIRIGSPGGGQQPLI